MLADAAKDARGPYQKLRQWWSFGIAFDDFLLPLDTERVAFLQNLDTLLSSADIPDTQRGLLMRDPHCVLWNDPPSTSISIPGSASNQPSTSSLTRGCIWQLLANSISCVVRPQIWSPQPSFSKALARVSPLQPKM